MTGNDLNFPRTELDVRTGSITFYPPVHEQRHQAVYEVLCNEKWNGGLKKVIDFGCDKLNFFKILKVIDNVNEVLCIDINENHLNIFGQKAEPSFEDNISPRKTPFHAKVYKGSIGQQDPCLLNTDAIVCIEVIEHLYPYDLDNLPFTIFGFTQPKLAIFTTPNVEFNILFPDPTKFRHDDHKFEWTRQQFQDWAYNIILRYPNYCVEFHNIGPSPKNYEHLGPVTQMAIFSKIKSTPPDNTNLKENCCNYKLLYDYVYPVKLDKRSTRQKIQDEIEYYISTISNPHCDTFIKYYKKFDNVLAVPLELFYNENKNIISSVNALEMVLSDCGFNVNNKQVLIYIPPKACTKKKYYKRQ